MEWLTGALAFATTMLFFAVVVSTLVELIHRFFGLREAGLQLMLESLFERVVKPQLERIQGPTIDVKEFVKIIMANRAVAVSKNADDLRKAVAQAQAAFDASSEADKAGRQADVDKAKLALDEANKVAEAKPDRLSWIFQKVLSPSQMTNIPVEMFTQKLADSRIINTADARLEAVVTDISQKYVAFGAEATEYFRRRARFLSVLVAFPVAFFFYIHPYDLARTFISDPELANKVAAYNVDLAYGKDPAVGKQPVSGGQTDGGAVAPGPAAPTVPATENQEQGASATTQAEEIAQLKNQVKALKQGIKEWDALAIPVGWPDNAEVPKCEDPNGDGDSRDAQNWLRGGCTGTINGVSIRRPDFSQIFWLLIGGLLVGLGAPFWAQAVGALTVSRGPSEKIASIVGGGDMIEAPAAGAKTEAITRALPKSGPTPVRTFQVARKAI